MWVTIYVAFITLLLVGCSLWAMRKADKWAQGIFACGSVLLACLLLGLGGCVGEGKKLAVIIIKECLLSVCVLLFANTLIGAFNRK